MISLSEIHFYSNCKWDRKSTYFDSSFSYSKKTIEKIFALRIENILFFVDLSFSYLSLSFSFSFYKLDVSSLIELSSLKYIVSLFFLLIRLRPLFFWAYWFQTSNFLANSPFSNSFTNFLWTNCSWNTFFRNKSDSISIFTVKFS